MTKLSLSWKWILPLAVFLLAAPLWSPYVQQANGRNLFLEADSMVLLGAALLAGWIGKFLIPEAMLSAVEKLFGFVRARFFILAAIFLPLLVLVLYEVNQKILHSFMNSADEHSCYFLAECIRMGKWFVTPHPLSEFFNVVHVGNRDGKWFSVYPPGWPVLMALGLEWHILDWLNPVLATPAVILLFKSAKKVYGFSTAWAGLLAFILTPYFILTSASYFSHATCLLVIALFLYSELRWEESRSESAQILWGMLAGFAVGYGLNTRYLTMAAIAAPFILFRLYRLIFKKEKLNKSHFVFAALIMTGIGLVIWQNVAVTGKPFNAPNHYDKRWEHLGFMGDYTVLDGLIYIAARFFYLADWVPPALIVLFFAGLFQKRSLNARQNLFRFGLFYLVIAYFFYYSWGGNQFGPRYYFEGIPFLAWAAADSIRFWWKQGELPLKKFLLSIVLVSVVTAGYQLYKHGNYFEVASRQRKALYELAETTLDKPSIVFIKGFLGDKLVMSQDDAIRNSPRLSGKILYAKDIPEKNHLLREFYPDREYYVGTFERSTGQAKLEKVQ